MVRGRHPVHYECETRGILIRVTPRFLHDESEPGRSRYVWAYTVDIENKGEKPWQLLRRHWRIIDSAGRVNEVDGEGVIGQTPRLEPGESFNYTSGAPLATPSGVMGGHYVMMDDDGMEMQAVVPTFSLDSPYERSRPS